MVVELRSSASRGSTRTLPDPVTSSLAIGPLRLRPAFTATPGSWLACGSECQRAKRPPLPLRERDLDERLPPCATNAWETIYRRLMRVHLDSGKCQGHNRCYALAPELFDVDDYGQAVLLVEDDVPEDLESKARLAASNCPEYAITITE